MIPFIGREPLFSTPRSGGRRRMSLPISHSYTDTLFCYLSSALLKRASRRAAPQKTPL